jgi:cell division septation protein DedD
MRRAFGGLAVILVASSATGVSAQQQGSLQVSAAAQAATGEAVRLAGQEPFEPDVGITWSQPGTWFGSVQMELRGTRRGDLAHLGRAHVALRDVKYRGLAWTFEGGDSYFTPAIGDYRFTNLFTPSVTFAGAGLEGRGARTNVRIIGGRATAARNIFGSDPDSLAQTLAVAQVGHRANDRFDIGVRASRIETRGLREFTYSIASSRQAGGGGRFLITPAVHLVADGSFVDFRREGSGVRQRDASGLVGASVLLARGWIQVNASRFSPGEFPTLHYPLQDRAAVFAAAEYDVWRRLRLFGGWEAFRSNLDPDGSKQSSVAQPRGTGTRGFGGMRLQVASRSAFTFRIEDGDRISRPILDGRDSESDTGSWSAEWQASLGSLTAFTRYARRENVDRANTDASYTQHDASTQLFVNLSRSTQLFGVAIVTRHAAPLSASTYWQVGGGTEIQVPGRNLWMRGELTASRNIDILTQSLVPRESVNVGINGQLTPHVALAVNVYADRAPALTGTGAPWATRSTVRLTHTFATRAVRVPGPSATLTGAGRARGTGTVIGMVFADWNGNGTLDPDEEPLASIPVRVGDTAAITTARDGEFAFLNVPAGFQRIGLDTGALPLEFDPPAEPTVELELDRGDTRRVAFGLIPLGSVHGQVLRDANANGTADAGDEPLEGAVLVLDGGLRSEMVRKGRFRFDAVRSGDHTLKLLVDSLPSGATIAGSAEVPVSLSRDRLNVEVSFAVSLDRRPEVRKVFPARTGASRSAPASGPQQRAAAPRPRAARERRIAPAAPDAPSSGGRGGRFAVQVAALNSRAGAAALLAELLAGGFAAYLVTPPPASGPIRVRLGPFPSRAAAAAAAARLEKARGIKPWIVRETEG